MASADEGECRDRHLAQNEHGCNDPAPGKATYPEERDVDREVVAAGRESQAWRR